MYFFITLIACAAAYIDVFFITAIAGGNFFAFFLALVLSAIHTKHEKHIPLFALVYGFVVDILFPVLPLGFFTVMLYSAGIWIVGISKQISAHVLHILVSALVFVLYIYFIHMLGVLFFTTNQFTIGFASFALRAFGLYIILSSSAVFCTKQIRKVLRNWVVIYR